MTLRVFVGVVLCSLAACSLQTNLTGGTTGRTTGRATGGTPVATGSTPAGPRPSNRTYQEHNDAAVRAEEAERDRYIPGNANCEGSNRAAWMERYRESCDPREPLIVGLSVADAKKKIAATHAALKIKVIEQYEFDKDCKADHVCGFEPRRWYVEGTYEVTLRINRKLDIGPPAD